MVEPWYVEPAPYVEPWYVEPAPYVELTDIRLPVWEPGTPVKMWLLLFILNTK